MKNLSKYIIILVFLFIATSACKDLLNKAPLDAPSNENFFKTKDELELALNGAYNASLWWEVSAFGNNPGPEHLDDGTDIGFFRSGIGIKPVAQGAATSETEIFTNTWDQFYSGISRVNNLLQNLSEVQDVSQDELDIIEAQAKFLRAYDYSYLTELYGDVPLLTEVLTLDEAQKSRMKKDKVVEQIMQDLDFIASNLPNKWGGDDEGRITSGAALALKARVALFNGDYSTAAQAAQAVINSGVYSLYPNYEGMFQYEGIRNSGVILDAPYSEGVHTHVIPLNHGSRMLNSFSTSVPSQFLIDSYQAIDGKPIDESPIYDPHHPFRNRDPRLDASIVRPQSILANIVYETNPDSTMTWKIVNGDSLRVANEDGTNPYASFTGYLWRKYTDPQDYPSHRTSSSLNFILIRYAEVLLTYAESKIEMGDIDQAVLDAMNSVRARAYGVSSSQSSQYPEITTTNQNKLRRQLRYERKVEFAGEGLRWFDIRRWGIAEEVMNGPLIGRPKGGFTSIPTAPQINDKTGQPNYGSNQDLYRNVEQRSYDPNRDALWAIPQKEIDVNKNIKQNPGY